MPRRKRPGDDVSAFSRPQSNLNEVADDIFGKSDKRPAALRISHGENGITSYSLAGFTMTPAGLTCPAEVTMENIEIAAAELLRMESTLQLWIGDLLARAEELEAGAIARLAERFGYEPQTFRNWKSVCSRVTAYSREYALQQVTARSDDYKTLTMGHYTLLAPLPEDEQRALMQEAMLNYWSVKQLRAAIKEHQGAHQAEASVSEPEAVQEDQDVQEEETIPPFEKVRQAIDQSYNTLLHAYDSTSDDERRRIRQEAMRYAHDLLGFASGQAADLDELMELERRAQDQLRTLQQARKAHQNPRLL